jgi:tRNA(Ile)-lysidine synthase
MLETVNLALARLLRPGEALLAGVSGGADSVALLDILVRGGWRPHVCHLNHQLRGNAAETDAAFVRRLAGHHQLACTIESRDVTRFAADHGYSLEQGARHARLEFFEAVAARTGIGKLALAHNADDQVETFLMRLLRGAGVPGLVGIWPERQIGSLRVIRPLLGARREAIRDYLAARGLAWREDQTNADRRFIRNRIRHELLPMLEREFNPAIREVLARTAEILRDEDFYLLHHVARRYYMAVCRDDAVNVRALADCPVAVQRRLVRFWLGGETEHGPRYSFEQIEAVRQLALADAPGGQVDLPDELVAWREYDWLRKAHRRELQPLRGEWPVALEGTTRVRELNTEFVAARIAAPAAAARARSARPARCEEQFDLDTLGAGLVVRTWRQADRFQPLGMSQPKKLQDFFVDEKIPRHKRHRLPVLCAGDGRVVWVVGHRIADPFKITAQTRRILKLRARPLA